MKIAIKKNKFLFLFILIIASSCKFNSNRQGNGIDFLQGIWIQQQVLYQNQRLNYSLHTFKFKCDSFYLKIDTYAQVNIYADTCYHQGHWQEYVKGTYHLNQDTLSLMGTFTKSNYKQKISGCYRVGQYLKDFSIIKKQTDTLLFQDFSEHVPIELHLKKKLSCSSEIN